ncbi:MAG: hypothetical protein AB1497_03350 [Bacillota bacterium]
MSTLRSLLFPLELTRCIYFRLTALVVLPMLFLGIIVQWSLVRFGTSQREQQLHMVAQILERHATGMLGQYRLISW